MNGMLRFRGWECMRQANVGTGLLHYTTRTAAPHDSHVAGSYEIEAWQSAATSRSLLKHLSLYYRRLSAGGESQRTPLITSTSSLAHFSFKRPRAFALRWRGVRPQHSHPYPCTTYRLQAACQKLFMGHSFSACVAIIRAT